ncbi:Peroxiredoxin [Parasphingorhabdus marina DSM 22363]|uniref:Peroxiredoxin n=1 Tax=Parasphingorhabdus marina DSM 22363 TaxID=1123272 RepID=A0A1N6DA22_9SPHN|nr:redoxin domain-containing protein [Parasphingorhabdus marina]SIN67635.1 Peroxiredoxin [Parasphingorhabdus marina DSM 22363]
MTMHSTLLPGQIAPDLIVPKVGGGNWSLADTESENFVIIDFYRGWHCPRCKLHILDLKTKLARFEDRGVACVAISMDAQDRAERAVAEWGLEGMEIGYELSEEQARAWGLYLTDAINECEPRRFSEPATIMVFPKTGEIYSVVYGSNPFNRIHATDVLEGLDAVLARNYPARGSAI